MNKEKLECALCKLPVEVEGFSVLTTEGLKKFCCEGCLCAYQLFNDDIVEKNSQREERQP